MTSSRFERDLPAVLEDLYMGPVPAYRHEVLAAATNTRQRPSWTFPGRWLPVLDIAIRPVAAPQPRLRAVALVLLLVLVLMATFAIVGSRPRVPPSFGPARNGLITWALNGDIWAGDPETGVARPVVATEDLDRNPSFSRDGTHLAFLRQVPTETGRFDLIVTRPDGTFPVTVSPTPIGVPDAVEWSPDSASILVNGQDGTLVRYFVTASAPQPVLQGVHIEPDAFRPPDGTQLLYERDDDLGALYAVDADGSNPHELFGPGTSTCQCAFQGPARWSPDGRKVAFSADPDGLQSFMYVIDADGTNLQRLPVDDGVWAEFDPAWSPDSKRIAFNRWQRSDSGDWSVRPIAVVDLAAGTLTPVGMSPAEQGALIDWAPDGGSILSLPATLTESFTWSPTADGSVARPTLINISDGHTQQLDWSVGSAASWQRLAP